MRAEGGLGGVYFSPDLVQDSQVSQGDGLVGAVAQALKLSDGLVVQRAGGGVVSSVPQQQSQGILGAGED